MVLFFRRKKIKNSLIHKNGKFLSWYSLFNSLAYNTLVPNVAHSGYTRLDLCFTLAISSLLSFPQRDMRYFTKMDAILRDVRTKYQRHEEFIMLISIKYRDKFTEKLNNNL